MIWIHCSPKQSLPVKRAKTQVKMDGILPVDKPYGCSSFDVIRWLKHHFGILKLGHAGTLDPLATGLLIVVLGKATKLSQQLMCGIKEYTGIIQLGTETSTYDREGEIVVTQSISDIDDAKIRNTMKSFLGDQYQNPPMFSAKKHEGTPLYKLARKGKDIERSPNFISIENFDMVYFESPDVHFHVKCSKGTYIRSLAHDLGERLGCGGHLAALRRIRSGEFSIDQAIALKDLLDMSIETLKEHIIPCDNYQFFQKY